MELNLVHFFVCLTSYLVSVILGYNRLQYPTFRKGGATNG